MLASADNHYKHNIDIYTGKTIRTEGSVATSVIKNCIVNGRLRDQGYHVYTDNFFTSPCLVTELWENYGIVASGTIRTNRAGLPKDIVCKNPSNINR